MKHPDVMLYHSFGADGEKIHLHITTWETPDFPHGLELAPAIAGENREEVAEAWAMKVQEYVDLMRKGG